ncbi:hypothetical protein [Borreliella turdi]|uniref:hypothetical protein n=1 Tax=Borreliella turdi TaxID=57863 RepID=UPI001F1637A2|nr:hypothetical protein [Borreliella turdi]
MEISIRACKAFRDSKGDFSEYNKLIKIRNEVISKILKDLQNQVWGAKNEKTNTKINFSLF